MVDLDGMPASIDVTFAGQPADAWERFRVVMRSCAWKRAPHQAAYNFFAEKSEYEYWDYRSDPAAFTPAPPAGWIGTK